MFSLTIDDLNNFSVIKQMKKFSADLLYSTFANDYPELNEKQLKQVINKLLTKEINEILNEVVDNEVNNEELNEFVKCYQEDFANDLKNAVNEYNKCCLNKIGNVKMTYNGYDVAKFKHSVNKNNDFTVHQFSLGLTD